MPSQDVNLNNGQQAIIHTDSAKTFLWNRRSQVGDINNPSYSDLVVPEGTVMGRVSATGRLKVLASGSSDGSQLPIGIMIGGKTIQYGETLEVAICDDGDVNENNIILQGSDTLDTVVSSRTLRDWLKLVGVKCVTTNEMTAEDND